MEGNFTPEKRGPKRRQGRQSRIRAAEKFRARIGGQQLLKFNQDLLAKYGFSAEEVATGRIATLPPTEEIPDEGEKEIVEITNRGASLIAGAIIESAQSLQSYSPQDGISILSSVVFLQDQVIRENLAHFGCGEEAFIPPEELEVPIIVPKLLARYLQASRGFGTKICQLRETDQSEFCLTPHVLQELAYKADNLSPPQFCAGTVPGIEQNGRNCYPWLRQFKDRDHKADLQQFLRIIEKLEVSKEPFKLSERLGCTAIQWNSECFEPLTSGLMGRKNVAVSPALLHVWSECDVAPDLGAYFLLREVEPQTDSDLPSIIGPRFRIRDGILRGLFLS